MDAILKEKNFREIINWLRNGATKDAARTTLQCIHIDRKNGFAVSSDGWHLRTTPIQAVGELANLGSDNIFTAKPLNKDGVAIVNTDSDQAVNFPDVMQVIPPDTTDWYKLTVKPQYLWGIFKDMDGIDAELMVSIIKDMDKDSTVKLCFNPKSKNTPLEIYGYVDDNPVYALLMPCISNQDHIWKPRDAREQPKVGTKEGNSNV